MTVTPMLCRREQSPRKLRYLPNQIFGKVENKGAPQIGRPRAHILMANMPPSLCTPCTDKHPTFQILLCHVRLWHWSNCSQIEPLGRAGVPERHSYSLDLTTRHRASPFCQRCARCHRHRAGSHLDIVSVAWAVKWESLVKSMVVNPWFTLELSEKKNFFLNTNAPTLAN